LILAAIRSQNDIALALALSGIAVTLLPGGRIAHSTLKLPLNMQFIETPTCNISKASDNGKVLQKYKLIVWDECTMAQKISLEALARFAWKHQTILERINIARRRFQANITGNWIDTSGRNKCLPEIIFYFVATSKDVKINFKYACPAAKRSNS
jgi:hypothetical protein